MIYWVPDAGIATEGVALAAALSVPRPRSLTINLLAVFFALSLTEDLGGGWWIALHGNNLWLGYFEAPLNAALVLWSFVPWQRSGTIRLAIRISVVLYAVACVALILTAERPTEFGTYSYPIQSLLILGAAVYTLVTRARSTDEPLVRQDWFWICIGWCIAHLFTLASYPILNTFLRAGDMRALRHATDIRIGASGIGLLCIAFGFRAAARSARRTAAVPA